MQIRENNINFEVYRPFCTVRASRPDRSTFLIRSALKLVPGRNSPPIVHRNSSRLCGPLEFSLNGGMKISKLTSRKGRSSLVRQTDRRTDIGKTIARSACTVW